MKISPRGAVIMSGAGLASVKQRIEAAFRDARTHSAETRIERVEVVELGVSPDTTTPRPTPLRPLAERAQPIFRACEQRLQHVVKRHSGVHFVRVPTESVEQLYSDALRSGSARGAYQGRIARTPGAKKSNVRRCYLRN